MPIAGLRAIKSHPGGRGGLGRRHRYAEGGEVIGSGPNAEGGMTYEQEAEWIARQIASANFQPTEQNRTIEEQLQEGPKAIAAANLANNVEYQASLQEAMVGQDPLRYGAGPPYTEATQPYNGPPPMEAGADWNYSSGVVPSNWHDYNSNNTTTGGGFFNFDELFHDQGRAVPQAFSSGSNMPSTNNYRLLPPDFRTPRYIMRNGQIIDMQGGTMYGPVGSGGMGDSDITNPRWRSGAGVGMPVAYAPSPISWAVSGWPGAFGYQLHSMGGT